MMTKMRLDICRPCLRRLPLGAGRIYRHLGGYQHGELWRRQGLRVTRGTDHKYSMVLDLADVFQRETYYLGKFYEWDVQEVMQAVLRPGDTFVDVGANIGMLMLLGARLVGEEGHVLAFEPNPEPRTHLQMHVLMNRLKNVQVFDVALSYQRQELALSVSGDRSGVGTLRELDDADASFAVHTALLDDYVEHIPSSGRLLLKTDVEGYDFHVLKGASGLLARREVAVISEVNPQWLNEVGCSAEEMFAYMADLGYSAYHPKVVRRGLSRVLTIAPLSLPGPHSWFNALFCRESELPMLRTGQRRVEIID